jgi:hypothetical protein
MESAEDGQEVAVLPEVEEGVDQERHDPAKNQARRPSGRRRSAATASTIAGGSRRPSPDERPVSADVPRHPGTVVARIVESKTERGADVQPTRR